MATIKATGIDVLSAKLGRLSAATRDKVIGPGVYAGAAVVADAVRQELQAVPTDERWGTPETPTIGPKKAQKKGLYDSLGITPMLSENGFFNVKIGFDGYNQLQAARWPKGQPNQMVARAVVSGTTFMLPNPFIKAAVSKSRRKAVAKLKETIEAEIDKIMEG